MLTVLKGIIAGHIFSIYLITTQIYIYVPRKALAWKSLNKMDNIWKGNIDKNLKILLFRVTTNNYFILISEMGTGSLIGESIGWHIHSDVKTSTKSVI